MVLITVHHLVLIIEKKNFSVLGEGLTDGINDSIDAAEKNVILILVKQRQKFA